jgi:hypothetical protein
MSMRKVRELGKQFRENINPINDNQRATSPGERRTGLKDRRKQNTFLARDRRSGIADRRNN